MRTFEAGALGEQCRSQPQRAAADHRHFALACGQDLAYGERARAPRQRPAAAAVTVVMNDRLAAEPLGFDARPLRTKRSCADGDRDEAVRLRAHERQDVSGMATAPAGATGAQAPRRSVGAELAGQDA